MVLTSRAPPRRDLEPEVNGQLLQIPVYTSLEIQEQLDTTTIVEWQHLGKEHRCDSVCRIDPKMRVVYTSPAVTTTGAHSALNPFFQLEPETKLIFSRT